MRFLSEAPARKQHKFRKENEQRSCKGKPFKMLAHSIACFGWTAHDSPMKDAISASAEMHPEELRLFRMSFEHLFSKIPASWKSIAGSGPGFYFK